MARMDNETAESFRQFEGISRLLPFAPILDFYGSHILIRNGRMAVPGGETAEPAWKSLAGADPGPAQEVVGRVLGQDSGVPAAPFHTFSPLCPPHPVPSY